MFHAFQLLCGYFIIEKQAFGGLGQNSSKTEIIKKTLPGFPPTGVTTGFFSVFFDILVKINNVGVLFRCYVGPVW
jgi:hypothetical protein